MSAVNARTDGTIAPIEEIPQILIEKCESILVSDVRRCLGCRACVKACGKAGGSMLAGRWLTRGTVKIAPNCRTCKSPKCLVACTRNAIRKETRRVLIDKKACVMCGRCVKACPFGGIHVFATGESEAKSSFPCEPGKPAARRLPKEISKCDRCAERGSPACVHECPTGALRFIDYEKLQLLMETQRVRMRETTGGHGHPVPNGEVALCRFP